jgi:class 3 adenylate cyclase/CHASE2 domain-containing sensor protein
MSRSRPRLRIGRLLRPALPVAMAAWCALLAWFAVGNLAFLTNADQFIADWETARLAPAEPQDPDIVIVAITEDTLAQFPYRAPVDRQFLAYLLAALAQKQPRAIGIDILFDQPTETAKDAALRQALAGLKMPVRIAYTDTAAIVTPGQREFLDGFVPPGMRAMANLATDQFDVVRWVFPGQVMQSGQYVMGFSRALAEASGTKTPREQVPVVWHGRPDAATPAFRQFPAHAVRFLPAAWFRNKIVLIGTDITLVDRHRTPFMTAYSGGEGVLPGVLIQAHALSQLLHGRAAPAVPPPAQLAITFALGLLGAVLGLLSWPIMLRLALGPLLVLAYWGGSAALFHMGGPQVGLVAPMLAFALAFFGMEAASGSQARAQRKFLEGVFSQHVAPEVVEQIIQDPARMTSLEGERRTMTFLFTDVADFTTMSENVESKELSRVLNAYLEGMTEIVQKHGGMVDKFIGDAVMAIFNAPIDLPDHAGAAVRCALEMDDFAARFSAEQRGQGIPFGLTRIGVHTGTAVVGNFGSRKRHNYTASGDAVNTAARLEGLNKYFGTRISVSDATRALCRGMNFRPTASVVLKGKSNAVFVWEPQQPDADNGFLKRYREAYLLLERGDAGAGAAFETLARDYPEDPCVAYHLERIRQGQTGVAIVMSEK